MKQAMTSIHIGEGPGIEIVRIITHHGYFFGHYDADLETRELPASESFDPATLDWPQNAVILRVMHRITRIRVIWGEEFPGHTDAIKSKRVYVVPGTVLATTLRQLKPFTRKLKDYDGADRLLRLGNVEGILVHPQLRIWAKLRQGEYLASQP